jgi:hypothetical protein
MRLENASTPRGTPRPVGPRVHGVTPSWVADGGDGLQIQRVATNVLSKQSRTTKKD